MSAHEHEPAPTPTGDRRLLWQGGSLHPKTGPRMDPRNGDAPWLVVVAGGIASGKSELAALLAAELDALALSPDDHGSRGHGGGGPAARNGWTPTPAPAHRRVLPCPHALQRRIPERRPARTCSSKLAIPRKAGSGASGG
jgi:hypothetical protein